MSTYEYLLSHEIKYIAILDREVNKYINTSSSYIYIYRIHQLYSLI